MSLKYEPSSKPLHISAKQLLTVPLDTALSLRILRVALNPGPYIRSGFLARSLRPTDAAFPAHANATLRARATRTGARTRRPAGKAAVSRTARPDDSVTSDARSDVLGETARVPGLDRGGEVLAGGAGTHVVPVSALGGRDCAV